MALVGVELETLVFEPDAQTTRPPPCNNFFYSNRINLCSDSVFYARQILSV